MCCSAILPFCDWNEQCWNYNLLSFKIANILKSVERREVCQGFKQEGGCCKACKSSYSTCSRYGNCFSRGMLFEDLFLCKDQIQRISNMSANDVSRALKGQECRAKNKRRPSDTPAQTSVPHPFTTSHPSCQPQELRPSGLQRIQNEKLRHAGFGNFDGSSNGLSFCIV